MKIKNFVPIVVVVLLMTFATLACADDPDSPDHSSNYTYIITVWGRSGITIGTTYYCNSYSIGTDGTLTISNCKGGVSKVFSASKKWEIERY